ncbi:hypothetical protein BerOc1_02175 [Pseudodesulfovibrio hydrargyri]|uniref:Uncharacterized protein n=1 Tax=Pseudodesulfovibrio hydrargyri TaxID=2125990 RepID=A0A1J5MWQ3_9BACT|nr:hypothetical protein [Pseudodesulfovibrio hydrargyri]OIQ50244.1 hypothetical protein BerOc1_02175 [Pseudodesulfovibrio hydrargyri]
MKRFTLSLSLASLILTGLLATAALALEVTDTDMAGDSPFKVTVVTPVASALLGRFQSGDDIRVPFAYALEQREKGYVMYVKFGDKFSNWVPAALDGESIVFGEKGNGRIFLEGGKVYRTLKGRFKTELRKQD